MCRQFIREFCGLETPIFMYGVRQDGKVEHDEEDYLVRTLGEVSSPAYYSFCEISLSLMKLYLPLLFHNPICVV